MKSTTNLRDSKVEEIISMLEEKGYEVLRVKNAELAIPVLDEERNERWLRLTIAVPTGTHDGEAYDGYAMAEEYKEEQAEKAEKAQLTAKKKAMKIAEDKKKREKKAEQEQLKKLEKAAKKQELEKLKNEVNDMKEGNE